MSDPRYGAHPAASAHGSGGSCAELPARHAPLYYPTTYAPPATTFQGQQYPRPYQQQHYQVPATHQYQYQCQYATALPVAYQHTAQQPQAPFPQPFPARVSDCQSGQMSQKAERYLGAVPLESTTQVGHPALAARAMRAMPPMATQARLWGYNAAPFTSREHEGGSNGFWGASDERSTRQHQEQREGGQPKTAWSVWRGEELPTSSRASTAHLDVVGPPPAAAWVDISRSAARAIDVDAEEDAAQGPLPAGVPPIPLAPQPLGSHPSPPTVDPHATAPRHQSHLVIAAIAAKTTKADDTGLSHALAPSPTCTLPSALLPRPFDLPVPLSAASGVTPPAPPHASESSESFLAATTPSPPPTAANSTPRPRNPNPNPDPNDPSPNPNPNREAVADPEASPTADLRPYSKARPKPRCLAASHAPSAAAVQAAINPNPNPNPNPDPRPGPRPRSHPHAHPHNPNAPGSPTYAAPSCWRGVADLGRSQQLPSRSPDVDRRPTPEEEAGGLRQGTAGQVQSRPMMIDRLPMFAVEDDGCDDDDEDDDDDDDDGELPCFCGQVT